MNEEFPRRLLENVYWSFGGARFEDQAEFELQLRQYQLDIKGADEFKPSEIVLRRAAVDVVYGYWKQDEEVSERVGIYAANGEFFTAGELLFKIHNLVTENLRGMDRRYFEGLSLRKPPVYWLNLGS